MEFKTKMTITTKQKAKEIINYVMDCCGINQTEGTPIKEMVKEIEFIIDTN
jgi:hypothetical protein